MSGSSFDYLCFKELGEVLASHQLQCMADALAEYDGAEHAAADTLALIAFRPTFEERIKPLRDVWHAVEWHHSSDWGPESVAKALRTYQATRVTTSMAIDAERITDRVMTKLPGGPAGWSWLRGVLRGAIVAAIDTENG